MTNKNNAYIIVNFIFVIIIGIVLSYSYFFYPSSHPIGCLVKDYTGKNCSTCGFSRAFSAFSHFEFHIGKVYNHHAFGCYLFFVFQFLFRGMIVFVNTLKIYITSKFIVIEIILTILFFLITFLPLIL
jgi:hypothetical protein